MSKEFIEEVEEELRKEQVMKIWKSYGNIIIGSILGLIVVIAAYMAWDFHQERKQIEESTKFYQALMFMAEGDEDKAKSKFHSVIETTKSGYDALAKLHLHAMGENLDPAIADDKDVPTHFKEIVLLGQAIKSIDDDTYAEYYEQVREISEKAGPWSSNAAEIRALMEIKRNQVQNAIQIFNILKDDKAASQGVRQRAAAMLEFLRTS